MPALANGGVARKIFLIATEESGDRLGAQLMKVLRQRLGGAVRQSEAAENLQSQNRSLRARRHHVEYLL